MKPIYKIFFVSFNGTVILDPNHEEHDFYSVEFGFECLDLWKRMKEDSVLEGRTYLILPVMKF